MEKHAAWLKAEKEKRERERCGGALIRHPWPFAQRQEVSRSLLQNLTATLSVWPIRPPQGGAAGRHGAR